MTASMFLLIPATALHIFAQEDGIVLFLRLAGMTFNGRLIASISF